MFVLSEELDTRSGEVIYVVRTRRLDHFKLFCNLMKEGGWRYSRYKRGFINYEKRTEKDVQPIVDEYYLRRSKL